MMAQVAVNADAYALTRIGIFFPAHNQTPLDGNLTGQCVTLNKWFLAEMTDVPNPFEARGDARYVGRRLVAEGHAVAVPFEKRVPGDFVVYEYGVYGHIGVLLSGDRIFEQNVNVGGVERKLVTEGKDSWYVYASRIGSLNEKWRPVQPSIYRIKSYNGDNMAKFTKEQEQTLAIMATGSRPGKDYNYPFTIIDISSNTLDKLLQTWQSRMTTITKEMESEVADGISGIPGYIGWAGYNSQFVGKPVISHYPKMVKYWIENKPQSLGKYAPITEQVYRKVS